MNYFYVGYPCTECTDQGDGYDGLFALPIQEEETSMRILSEPVTGGMQHFKHSSHKPSETT